MRVVGLPAIACLLFCRAALAQAPDADAARTRATALTKDAARAYQSGDYASALAKFEEAYAVFPSPRLLFNLGQTYERLGRYVEATESFQRFVAAGNAPASARAQAERAVEDMRNKVAHVEVTANVVGAEVSIDGKSQGLTPLPRPVLVSVGPHQVVVRKAGAEPVTRNVQTVGGAIARVEAELRFPAPTAPVAEPAPPPPPPAAPAPAASAPVQLESTPTPAPAPSTSIWRKVGVGMMIAAPVLAAVGLYYGSQAHSEAKKINDACNSPDHCTGKQITAADDARRDYGTKQVVLLGAGAAVLAGGAALFFTGAF